MVRKRLKLPATDGQFETRSFVLPQAGLTLNIDAQWSDGLSDEDAEKCDPLRELCQSYAYAELLDKSGKAVLPGFSAAEAEVIAGVDGPAVPLKWNSTAELWAARAGQEVVLRLTFRDAVIYSLGAAG